MEKHRPVPSRFEVEFGVDDAPGLEIGDGDDAVRLRGKIDRIDVVEENGTQLFRVIDYKTGSAPAA